MTSVAKYDTMKVGELRALCKSRGIDSDQKKDDLIAALRTADSDIKMDTTSTEPTVIASEAQNARNLTPDELRELATIADEMRHLRKQWIAQSMKPIPTAQSSTYRTAQKPSLNS